MTGDGPSLREYLEARDDHLEQRFNKFEADNADDHAAVLARLERLESKIEEKLSGVVTWPSLGFAVGLAAGVYALLEKLT